MSVQLPVQSSVQSLRKCLYIKEVILHRFSGLFFYSGVPSRIALHISFFFFSHGAFLQHPFSHSVLNVAFSLCRPFTCTKMLLNTKRKGKGKKPNKHNMTSLSHNTIPKSSKKCFFFFPFCDVRCDDCVLSPQSISHVTAADKVSDGGHWAGGHRRLVGDCYRGEGGSVTLHSRLTLALHLRTPFTLGQRLHCDAHT